MTTTPTRTTTASAPATTAVALRRTHLLRQLEEEGQQTVSAQTSFRDDTPEPPLIVHSYGPHALTQHNMRHDAGGIGSSPSTTTTKTATILVSKAKTKTGLPLMLKSSSNLK